jgi:hypothetical protein
MLRKGGGIVERAGDGKAMRHIALAGEEKIEPNHINPGRAMHGYPPSNVISALLVYIFDRNYNYV